MTNKSIKEILSTEGFPLRLMVYFASQCAKDAMSKIPEADRLEASIKTIEIAERYGNGEDFDKEYLIETKNAAANAAAAADAAAYAAVDAAAYAAAYAANAAANAAAAAYAAANAAVDAAVDAAAYAANAAAYAADAAVDAAADAAAFYKPLLLELINKRLTKLEKALLFKKY